MRINSISPSVEGENACAAEIRRALAERGVESAIWKMDADGRDIVWAMVEGGGIAEDAGRIPTVILLGHLDTAGVQEFGPEVNPFDPEELHDQLMDLYQRQPDSDDERVRDAASGDWMFGRGSFDMKSGVAAQIAVMGALARSQSTLRGNVLMISTPDEEVESQGLMDALGPLVALRDARRLQFVGVINCDYVAPLAPEDDRRPVYGGTIGKLLCCFYVRGCETHVGEAFRGLDANLIVSNLIQETNLNPDLCDEAQGEVTVPPVTQKVRDFKARYDAQTPISAVVHCSCLVHSWTPEQVLGRMVKHAETALSNANRRRALAWESYIQRQRGELDGRDMGDLQGRVWRYGQLHRAVEEKLGQADLRQELEERAFSDLRKTRCILERLSQTERDYLIDSGRLVGIDSRERSVTLVRTLVDIAIREEVFDAMQPAVVVFFAPPFFPPVCGDSSTPLSRAIATEVDARAGEDMVIRSFYPYVSELSYMRVDEGVYESLPTLKANFPLWRDPDEEVAPDLRSDYFSIPFDLIRELDCDVANIGPWGKEAHGRGERVYMPYAFETVPQLIHGVIVRVLRASVKTPRAD